MTALAGSLPWAVHVSDGFLTAPWWIGGFAVMGLLALFGAWRLRDEDVPRVAVLTAAFFVASLVHVPVPAGPRTHLLLNGLLGVVLGRRALVAIPVALFLQAALFGHGGFTTLGVNACVMGIPALLAGLLFAGLRRLPGIRRPGPRAVLVGGSAAVFLLSLVYALTLLYANFGSGSPEVDLALANRLAFRPATLAGVLVLSCLAAWGEGRLEHAPEFPLGLVVGEFAVAATIVLHGFVLLWGGAADWHEMVLLTVVIHLPLAVIEGLILGFTVGFLARVKPELLADWRPEAEPQPSAALPSTNGAAAKHVGPHAASGYTKNPSTLLLALVAALLTAAPAEAHNLLADYRVLPDGRVQIESWFDLTGDSPKGARVQVFRPDQSLLAEGKLDEKGVFIFPNDQMEPLKVVVSAGDGHRAELTIPGSNSEQAPLVDRSPRLSVKDVLIGLGFVLGLAAFLISVRNARLLRELERIQDHETTKHAKDTKKDQ